MNTDFEPKSSPDSGDGVAPQRLSGSPAAESVAVLSHLPRPSRASLPPPDARGVAPIATVAALHIMHTPSGTISYERDVPNVRESLSRIAAAWSAHPRWRNAWLERLLGMRV